MAKSKKVAPDGYGIVTTYLAVRHAGAVLEFIKKAFGGKVVEKHLNPDGSIMHASVKIGDTHVMLGECPNENIRTAMLYMYVSDCDAVFKKAVKAGGKPVMKPKDQFYGDRSGSVSDKGGNMWWIATRPAKKAPAKKAKKK